MVCLRNAPRLSPKAGKRNTDGDMVGLPASRHGVDAARPRSFTLVRVLGVQYFHMGEGK